MSIPTGSDPLRGRGSYRPREGKRLWTAGQNVRAKRDITTKAGLVLKAGDVTRVARNDPFEGSSHYNDFVTVYGTRKGKDYLVRVPKADVERIEGEGHVERGQFISIAELQGRNDLVLVTQDNEVAAIKDSIGGPDFAQVYGQDYGALFVKESGGEYVEVYAFDGTPDLSKRAERIV